MLLELNKFEKRSSLFLAIVLIGLATAFAYIAYKKSWFESKTVYYAVYQKAQGIHPGTGVTVAGISAGKVTEVILDDKNQIRVKFQILRRFEEKVRTDSVAKIFRPFIIGDKVIDISIGDKKKPLQPADSQMQSYEAKELVDFITGDQIGPYLETLTIALDKVKTIMDELLAQTNEKSVVEFVNELKPTMKALKDLALVLGNNDMKVLLKNTGSLSEKANKADVEKLIKNMEILSEEFAKVAPQMPEVTEKGIKVLDEAVWVLKGMEKSWFLRDHIDKEKQKAQEQPTKDKVTK